MSNKTKSYEIIGIMIEFVEFGEHKLDAELRPNVKDSLQNCLNEESVYYWLNTIYNNVNHFYNNAYNYDTYLFLKEISQIANSPQDKLVVMGGIHADTGHTSGLILHQITKTAQPFGSFVSDSYVRFRIKYKSPRRQFVLNEYQIFHFLVDVPTVSWLSQNKGTIFVHNIPHQFDDEYASQFFPKVHSNKIAIKRA
jgi:hypothetical protein